MSKKQSKKNQEKKSQQSSMKLEALEPRLLMSGDTYEDLNQAWDAGFQEVQHVTSEFIHSDEMTDALPNLKDFEFDESLELMSIGIADTFCFESSPDELACCN